MKQIDLNVNLCHNGKTKHDFQALQKSCHRAQHWSRMGYHGKEDTVGPRAFQGLLEMIPSALEAIWWPIPAGLCCKDRNKSQEILTEPTALRPWHHSYCYLWNWGVISRIRQMHNHVENQNLGHRNKRAQTQEPWSPGKISV